MIKHSRQEGSALAAMLILAHRANERLVCWPTVASIAEPLKPGVRQTKYLLRDLQQSGEIAVLRGLALGLAASGLYSGVKRAYEG